MTTPSPGDESVDVVTFGEPLTLMLAEPGVPLGRASAFDWHYAGAETNVAVALTRLGHRAGLGVVLGDDPDGARILRELRGEGVLVRHRLDAGRPTGLLLRDAVVGRPGTVAYHRAGSAATTIGPDDVPLDLLAAARVLHLTGITAVLGPRGLDACLLAARTAREHGVTVTLDPNVRLRLAGADRWREAVGETAGLADVVFPGDADLAALGLDEDPVAWFHSRGAGVVVLKEGEAGAVESGPDGVVRAPAHPVAVVDTVGAGDAFAAGWISGYLRQVSAARRLREAAVVAACVVGARGDLPGLPTAAERDRILDDALEVHR